MPILEPRSSAGAIYVQGTISNLGAAETAYFVAPESGFIKELHCVRSAAGGTGTTELEITTQKGAVVPVLLLTTAGAAGDTDRLDLSPQDTNNEVVAGESFAVASDGAFSGTPIGHILVVMEPY